MQTLWKPALAVEDSGTSKDAARKIERPRTALRIRVYEFIAQSGGVTDEEIQIALDMNPSTERPRRVELVEANLVRDSSTRRRTKSGRWAVVWTA
jgi:hypothetical protein